MPNSCFPPTVAIGWPHLCTRREPSLPSGAFSDTQRGGDPGSKPLDSCSSSCRGDAFLATQHALRASWVPTWVVERKVGSIAARWPGVPVLDSGERGLERGPHYPLESPVLAWLIILRPQRSEGAFLKTGIPASSIGENRWFNGRKSRSSTGVFRTKKSLNKGN